MPRLGHYSEKYELNGGGSEQPQASYGSFRRDEQGALLSHDHLNTADDELESQASDHGLVMGPVPNQAPLFFRDGKRRIDYVLVYEDSEGARLGKHDEWRSTFMANLRQAGLDMEEELVEGESKSTHFIKLSVPWPVLLRYAEELCLRAPLQAHPNPSVNWSAGVLAALRIPNIMEAEVPNKPLDYYTCTFKRSKLDRNTDSAKEGKGRRKALAFLGSDNQDEYFTVTQRVCVAYEILQTARYGARRKAQIGIDRLIEEGVYTAAFPLHEGDYRKPSGNVPPNLWNRRQVLYEFWARWSCWYKYQPLDHIREYFGEKIGIYFAWLGFYTGWLLPAAAVGFLVFLYGIFTIGNDGPTNEICNSDKKYRMCPRCDEKYGCDYWYISDNCIFTKITYLFDHPGTVFYAIFVSFWAVTFLEYWKRKSASLAHHWDCMDFEEEEERPRPEFAARASHVERNPITGAKEPAFPARVRKQRIAAGVAILLLMIALVLVFMVSVIVYRVLVSIPLFRSQSFKGLASVIASSSGAFVNLIFIMILGKVYERLAYRLTQWEMHRTQTDFDNNLTLKVFLFQFVNFYSSIFYIAFFKGRFVGYPGKYGHLLGLRNEECSGSDCLSELAQQLAVIMVGKQMINNAQEILVPKVKAWWHRHKTKMVYRESLTRWEQDYQLIQNEGLFQEYLEMVLQFGFITIFVAAFPLAPLFALLNNWVEIRLDAQKFVCETRRCVPERAQNIGIWFSILEFLAKAAVISNAFLIAFTSDFLTRTMYRYEFDWDLKGYINFTLAHAPNGSLSLPCRYRDLRDEKGNWTFFHWKLLAVRLAFVIIFEHVVFCVCRLIDLVVPDIPNQLELKIKRERYLAKQALADSETIMKVAQRKDDDDDEEAEPPAV